jgi:hypothetical protein
MLDDHEGEAQFQEDRRKALATGSYEELQKHRAQYPGIYRHSGLPWEDDLHEPGTVRHRKSGVVFMATGMTNREVKNFLTVLDEVYDSWMQKKRSLFEV